MAANLQAKSIAVQRGAVILKGGIEYRVAKVSKTGVVTLNHTSGGFAMFSHVSVCKQLELPL